MCFCRYVLAKSGSNAVVDQKHTKGPHPRRHFIEAGGHPVGEAIYVTRLTEAIDLSVVCIGVRGQPVTFDQLQQFGDIQQKKIGPRTNPLRDSSPYVTGDGSNMVVGVRTCCVRPLKCDATI